MPLKQTVLFNVKWFDPNIAVKVHEKYKLVDVNTRSRFGKYEPFILAMQEIQVCYVPYPSMRKNKDDYVSVLKIKPRDIVELPEGEVATTESNLPYQVEEVEAHEIDLDLSIDENILLHDPYGVSIEMDEAIEEEEETT